MIKNISAPEDVRTDDKFSVWVRQGKEEWQPVSVYVALAPDGDSNWQQLPDEVYKVFDGVTHGTIAEKTYVAMFSFDGEVDVRVKYNSPVEKFNIKPCGSVAYQQNEDEVEFTLNKPCKLEITADDNIIGALHLLADKIEVFDKNGYENVIYFEKGYHTADNDENIVYNEHGVPVVAGVKDNTLIYAEQGAVVFAAIEMKNVSHVKVAGHGIFSLLDRCYGADFDFEGKVLYSGFRDYALPSIFVHAKSKDIIIQGVTLFCELRGITMRNVRNVLIDNVKMFSHCGNGDGISGMNVCDVEIQNSYLHNSDDNLALYTSRDSILYLDDEPEYTYEPHVSNVCMHDCVLWTNARTFVFGGHGTKSTNPHNVVENVKVYNCEITGVAAYVKHGVSYEHSMIWLAVFRILSQSEQHIRNIHFENIRFDWTKNYTGKPFHIEVRPENEASYTEGRGYRIENVIFKDIEFINVPQHLPTLFKSVDEDDKLYGVENITFENVTFDGKLLEASEIRTIGNVKNIVLK